MSELRGANGGAGWRDCDAKESYLLGVSLSPDCCQACYLLNSVHHSGGAIQVTCNQLGGQHSSRQTANRPASQKPAKEHAPEKRGTERKGK